MTYAEWAGRLAACLTYMLHDDPTDAEREMARTALDEFKAWEDEAAS